MGHVAAVFLTGLIGLIFYLEQGPRLHYTFTDLQLLCKSKPMLNHESVACITAVSVRISSHYSTYTILLLLLSPLGAMCAYSFITLGHRGNQTANPASVTVTLYQLSHTESFLLACDYSKIFCSTGPTLTRIPRPPY